MPRPPKAGEADEPKARRERVRTLSPHLPVPTSPASRGEVRRAAGEISHLKLKAG